MDINRTTFGRVTRVITFTQSGSGRVRDLQVGVMVDDVTLRATAAPRGTR
jgi:hypothetical protein